MTGSDSKMDEAKRRTISRLAAELSELRTKDSRKPLRAAKRAARRLARSAGEPLEGRWDR